MAISFDKGTVLTPDRSIQGLGILYGDRPYEPRYTLGRWSDDNVVQVFHAEPELEVIGITGEFNVIHSLISLLSSSFSIRTNMLPSLTLSSHSASLPPT